MPVITCKRCGSTTNTACSEWDYKETIEAIKCYAKHDGTKWVKGCAYDEIDEYYTKSFVDKLLLNTPPPQLTLEEGD